MSGNLSLFIDEAPNKISRRERLVWLVGRPLRGLASLLAPGGFPYLHWAVLTSPMDCDRQSMMNLFQNLRRWPSDIRHQPMGILQELRFDTARGQTTYRGGPFTTQDFIREFPSSSIAYAGITLKGNEEIISIAQTIWLKRHWDYRVLKSNCQHFASNLIHVLTGHEPFPRTIAKLIKSHIDVSGQPSRPLYTSASSPPTPRCRSVLNSLFSSSSQVETPNINPQPVAGLVVDVYHLRCFLQDLEKGERSYLESLGLGSPQSLHTFVITENRDTNRVARAIAAMYPEVFILFRYRTKQNLRSWDTTTVGSVTTHASNENCLLIYCYLYPRHIKNVSQTRNGFRIDCEGLWLGDRATAPAELLTLEFQEPAVPNPATAEGWMHSLDTFRGRDLPEIGTIFDRLPLGLLYITEVDILIEMKVYRTVTKRPLGWITATGVRDLVKRKLESWGQRRRSDVWTLQYKNRGGELCEVSDDFPVDTDGGWREFFAAVFYVDFPQQN